MLYCPAGCGGHCHKCRCSIVLHSQWPVPNTWGVSKKKLFWAQLFLPSSHCFSCVGQKEPHFFTLQLKCNTPACSLQQLRDAIVQNPDYPLQLQELAHHGLVPGHSFYPQGLDTLGLKGQWVGLPQGAVTLMKNCTIS